jgi:hypothetical protein
LWRGEAEKGGVVPYLKETGRCTVHLVRAPTEKRAVAEDWPSSAVLLRDCEAVPGLGS